MITGKCGGSSRASIHARSSSLLLEIGFVPYAPGSGCARTRRGIVGLRRHVLSLVVLLIARTTTLAVALPVLAVCGCGDGKMSMVDGGWSVVEAVNSYNRGSCII